MQSWGSGYVTDLEYDDGFYSGQSPRSMVVAATMNGVEAPDVSGPFTYCELGCGRGATSLILAAMHPQAEFHAIDFNPAHIAHATARARAAGLNNITFHERSFSDLTGPLATQLPMFDLITMHGVWTWIAPALQDAIVAFMDSRLNPGGLVYVSYNVMPGWSNVAPLQRLLKGLADGSAERSDVAAQKAVLMLERLIEAKAIPEHLQDGLKSIRLMLNIQRTTYLAHEYLNEHWKPLYHMDVARAFAGAKLSLAASTDLMRNFQSLVVTAEQSSLLAEIPAVDLRETLKDFCDEVKFRRDVYVRGVRRMSGERRDSILRELQLVLLREPPEIFHLDMPDGSKLRPDPAVYLPILKALKSRPHRVGELLVLPDLPDNHSVAAVELVGLLVGSRLAAIYAPPTPEALDASARLISVTYAQEKAAASHIPAPAIGVGITLSDMEQLLHASLFQKDAANAGELARRFLDYCHANGGHPVVEGVAIDDETEALATLTKEYALRIDKLVPLWRVMEIA